ncbi:LexA family protein [Paenibacillus thiaminolyticus]|uniref:LexA family protein n=1 Tax=Paenibacillus thiaminolyticus TaxID=49283 RepID=UPI0025434B66|nr:XRE family transcriptional regulator [Paenibacillus thiaminolyticus]WII39156.1 helix-turn-helix domain-containing protein [Paenibacillus thiaminolyticus]
MENDVKIIFAKNILRLRNSRGLTQLQLGEELGLGKTTISQWESAKKLPNAGSIEKIAMYFNVPKSTLFEENSTENIVSYGRQINLPIVEKMSWENGVFTLEKINGYEPTPEGWLQGKECFYFRVPNQAMSNARIHEGDLVLIQIKEEINEGDIAAILVDGEIILTRLYKDGETVILQSENPTFPPKVKKYSEIKVVGKLKKLIVNF